MFHTIFATLVQLRGQSWLGVTFRTLLNKWS